MTTAGDQLLDMLRRDGRSSVDDLPPSVTVLGTPINGTKMTKDEQIIELQNVVGSLQYDMNNMAKQIEALRELSETHDNALIEIEEVLEMGDDDE